MKAALVYKKFKHCLQLCNAHVLLKKKVSHEFTKSSGMGVHMSLSTSKGLKPYIFESLEILSHPTVAHPARIAFYRYSRGTKL